MPIVSVTDRQIEIEEHPELGSRKVEWLSQPGGLTRMGVYIEHLNPGAKSSFKHWHESEDEMVYVLHGQLTVHEGNKQFLITEGAAAAFPAGRPVGHQLENQTLATVTYIVAGTRAQLDRIFYTELDRVCVRDRAQPDDVWQDTKGMSADNPY